MLRHVRVPCGTRGLDVSNRYPLAGCLSTFSRGSCRPAVYGGPVPSTGRPPCPRLVPTEPSYQGSTLDSSNGSFYQHTGARLLPTAEAGGFRRDGLVERVLTAQGGCPPSRQPWHGVCNTVHLR